MYKRCLKQIIFVLLFSFVLEGQSRCLGETTDLKFYLDSKKIYLIKVVDLKIEGVFKIFKVQTLKSFKGNISKEFLIYTHNSDINWEEDADAGLNIDSIYLVKLNIDKSGKFNLHGCSYIISNKDKNFKRDSICLSAFIPSDVFVNNEYYKGAVVNGKPNGVWRDDLDSGTYKNGKRVGKWVENGENARYKNGRRVYFEESWIGDTIIIYNGKSNTMICRGQILSVWSFKKSGDKIDKYKKGEIYESLFYDKLGDVKEIRCYKNGSVINNKKYNSKKEEETFVREFGIERQSYFYYNDYKSVCKS